MCDINTSTIITFSGVTIALDGIGHMKQRKAIFLSYVYRRHLHTINNPTNSKYGSAAVDPSRSGRWRFPCCDEAAPTGETEAHVSHGQRAESSILAIGRPRIICFFFHHRHHLVGAAAADRCPRQRECLAEQAEQV